MKDFLCLIFAVIFATYYCPQTYAQSATYYSRNVELLQVEEPSVRVIKREVIPGVITFNRYNGCTLKIPVTTNFLDNGIALKSPAQLAISGNSIPQWRNEYKESWRSQLTDYERGEYKLMFFQIGQHPPKLIRVEESDKQLLEAQAVCAVAAYNIFGSNIRLIQVIPNQTQKSFFLPLNQGWNKFFSN